MLFAVKTLNGNVVHIEATLETTAGEFKERLAEHIGATVPFRLFKHRTYLKADDCMRDSEGVQLSMKAYMTAKAQCERRLILRETQTSFVNKDLADKYQAENRKAHVDIQKGVSDGFDGSAKHTTIAVDTARDIVVKKVDDASQKATSEAKKTRDRVASLARSLSGDLPARTAGQSDLQYLEQLKLCQAARKIGTVSISKTCSELQRKILDDKKQEVADRKADALAQKDAKSTKRQSAALLPPIKKARASRVKPDSKGKASDNTQANCDAMFGSSGASSMSSCSAEKVEQAKEAEEAVAIAKEEADTRAKWAEMAKEKTMAQAVVDDDVPLADAKANVPLEPFALSVFKKQCDNELRSCLPNCKRTGREGRTVIDMLEASKKGPDAAAFKSYYESHVVALEEILRRVEVADNRRSPAYKAKKAEETEEARETTVMEAEDTMEAKKAEETKEAKETTAMEAEDTMKDKKDKKGKKGKKDKKDKEDKKGKKDNNDKEDKKGQKGKKGKTDNAIEPPTKKNHIEPLTSA